MFADDDLFFQNLAFEGSRGMGGRVKPDIFFLTESCNNNNLLFNILQVFCNSTTIVAAFKSIMVLMGA